MIEDRINKEEYDVGEMMQEINDACKGTKAEPFLIKLKEYFMSKFSPDQVIYKLLKKLGKPQKEDKDEEQENANQPSSVPHTSSMDMGYPPPMGFIPGQMGGFQNFEFPVPHHPPFPQSDANMQIDPIGAFHNFIRGGARARGFPFRGRNFGGRGYFEGH